MNTTTSNTSKPRKPVWFLACILIIGAGIASFILLQALKPEPEQRIQTVYIPLVETMSLSYRQSPLLVEGNGTVSPRAEIGLSSQVTGEVVSMHENMATGGSFEKGTTFIQIDTRSFEANLAEAEANKDASVSNLNFLNKQIVRLESLREQGYTPEESLDDAISRRDQAVANIARLEAIIVNRQLDLERTSIKAPFAGKILSENVDVGDIVSPGRELARFYASDVVEVVVSLNTQDAAFIPGLWNQAETNQRRAWVTVNHGGQRYQWEGYLDRVEADIDSTTRTVDVVVRVPEPFRPGQPLENFSSSSLVIDPPPLLIGMYGTVSIEGLTLANHFVVPTSAVHENAIWVVGLEGGLQVVPVEVVREEGNEAVLLAPQLRPGAEIIISDIALVSDGMKVSTQASVDVTSNLTPNMTDSATSPQVIAL